jgi:predicted ATPase
MKLHSLKISGYKRIKYAELFFADATFLIGMNNAGKSSVLRAIEWLLSAKKSIPSQEYYSIVDEETLETRPSGDTIILEAEFRNLPVEATEWRGFKGRVFNYAKVDENDTGLSITYKKTYMLGKEVIVEIKSLEREKKVEFANCKTGQDFINLGVPDDEVKSVFDNLEANISAKTAAEKLPLLDSIWNIKEEACWFTNPGGIPAVVLARLPRFLLIPADASTAELEGGSSGVLGKTLTELFEDVRGSSENYAEAQKYLIKLAGELDPSDKDSEFGKMIAELNSVLGSVFPESRLHATASLSDPRTALKPTFEVEMSSNVKTAVAHQGSGMIRAAAFGMLRFRQKWLSEREDKHDRSLIVCFEEPETFLHPSAANQMRNAIYELSNSKSQIIATTHSPFIIDLSRKPRQILNCIRHDGDGISVRPFNVTEAYKALEEDDKAHVKMILKIDDYVARVFFTKHVVIVEGDTEEIVLKETLKRLPRDRYLKVLADFEIVKARGKAAIIGFAKYLIAMGFSPTVVHDRDSATPGAVVFNAPIAAVVAGHGQVVEMVENVEDEMGFQPSNYEKPYKAYKHTLTWGDDWDDLPLAWRAKMKMIFGDYVPA